MKKLSAFKQLLKCMLPYKLRVSFAIFSSIMNKLCDIVPEILIGISIDVIVNQQTSIVARLTGMVNPFNQLYLVGGLTALLWILESVFEYCYLIAWRGLAQDIKHSLRLRAYAHVQGLDMAYFEDKTTGGLLSIINDDIDELQDFLSQAPNEVIQLVVNIIVMGTIFFCFSPTLAWLTLLPIPFVVLIAFYFQKQLAVLYAGVRERIEALNSYVASRLAGIMTIKSYTTERYEVAGLVEKSLAYKKTNDHANRINAAYIPIVRMGVLCGFMMSLIVGGQYALQGTLSISFYSILVFLTQRFLWPFTTVTTITDMYERTMASAKRIFLLLRERQYIIDGAQGLDQHAIKGAIAFDNVSFSYSNGVQIFKNLSLTIPAKNTVAFVGSTGSGKSTIIKLLLRLYDSGKGSILLDGIDIKSVTMQSLRQVMALVSQEVYLINGTVAENIAYGALCHPACPPKQPKGEGWRAALEPGIHSQINLDSAVVHAARMAEAHDFIMCLPNGYQTVVGENGKNLSGGQRQRLAIARAIFKNPSIFIFDEATSALDNETEAAIQRSIATLAHNHTIIIIAHRLSTVRHADTIFVMEHGVVVEAGNHDELVAKNGVYAGLWKIQTGTV